MEAQNNTLSIIDEALKTHDGATVVSKNGIVDVFLDIRLAAQDPAVVAASDDAIKSFETPTLVEWDLARAELVRVRAIAAGSPQPAVV